MVTGYIEIYLSGATNVYHILLCQMTFCITSHSQLSTVCLTPSQELKETEELDIQLKVFNENKEEDSIELSHRLDDIRAEMEYPFVLPHCEYTDE